ncbi:hypothetical protein [Streptomyces sp. RTd22]|uniref:hypothetical protein n=1 Tax=Streptomyces sp. RTd22 TaxID=1841249 RepID=UPI0007C4BB5A|nr:hypothetical protein [Streptomyces sp. RTd22]
MTQHRHGGLIVPYISSWSAETACIPSVVRKFGNMGPFLAYADETAYDRGQHGALWVRQPLARGKGHPLMDSVHALRQRQAMRHMLCQVCRTPAVEASPERQIFLLKAADGPLVDGTRTTAPPVCSSCAPLATDSCPRLSTGGHVAAWVERAEPWGVAGVLYDPETLRPVHDEGLVRVAHGSEEFRWVIAHREVVILHGCTAVDMNDLRRANRRAAAERGG